MENEQLDWNAEWRGLEPKQPGSSQWGCRLAGVIIALLLLGACGAIAYLVWRQLGNLLEGSPILPVPTIVSGAGSGQGTPEANGSATALPGLAPTVTLPGTAAEAAIEVPRLQAAVSIDGNLEEWAAYPVVESSYLVFSAPSWDGSDDVMARWRLAWDETYLHVAVQIEDDVHVQTQTGNQVFKGDALSLQLDTRREADLGPGLSEDDYQIELSPGDFDVLPVSSYRFQGTGAGTMIDAPGHSVAIAASPINGGYQVEAAIPWRDLNVQPAPGLQLGIALNVNDNDTPGTAIQEVMKSHIPTRTFSDPNSWGTMTLR